MKEISLKLIIVSVIVLTLTAVYSGVAWLCVLIWNSLIVDFGAPPITFWHAMGIMFLVSLLGGLLRK